MLENEKIWILQNILSNVEEHNSAKLLRESLFKVIDGFAPLITASGAGIYTGTITPASEVPTDVGDKVFLVTEPGTYTNFGNVVLPQNSFGFIFKNGNSFSIQSVEMPMQDLTPLNNRVTIIENEFIDVKTKTDNIGIYNSNEDLLSVIDSDDNKLMSINRNGSLVAFYEQNSIPKEAVKGLDFYEYGIYKTPLVYTDGVFDLNFIPETKEDRIEEKVFNNNIYIQNAKFLTIRLIGRLPTDMSEDRLPSKGILQICTDNNESNCVYSVANLSIQGHGSSFYDKKGYTLDFLTKNNESLKLKINNGIETDSYHLKAFYTDISHTRDVGNSRLFRLIRGIKSESPIYQISNKYNDKTMFTDDAVYYPNGVPCAFYTGNIFKGLYTLRLKKTRENYSLDNSNSNHIFLDSITYSANLGSKTYSSIEQLKIDFEFKSPKNINTTTSNNVLRLFNWFNKVFTNSIDIKATAKDYIDVDSFIDYYITSEVIDNWDVDGNNINLISYDGVKFKIFLYDTDQSIGIFNGEILPEKNGLILDFDIWTNFRNAFINEIKNKYRELRNNGILSQKTFLSIYGDISASIPRSVYKNDYLLNGSAQSNAIADMNQLYGFLNKRIEYLDSIWLN